MRAIRNLAIILLLVFAVVAGAWWYLRGRNVTPSSGPRATASPAATGPGPTAEEVARCDDIAAKDKVPECQKVGYYVWNTVQSGKAHKANDPAACAAVDNAEDRDNCYEWYATTGIDEAPCGSISTDEGKQRCRSAVLSWGSDFSACASAPTDEDRVFCEQQVLINNRVDDPSYCDQYEVAVRTRCLERYWTVQATTKVDYQACRKIADAAAAQRCLASLPVDTDGDGLSDYAEQASYRTDPKAADSDSDGLSDYDELRVYRTDPKKVDTDSDGYSDGVEVQGGFDPRGPGRLQR
ncbi:MAG: hypothetical protein G01um101431_1117 [Parcubacteria group bacterium Gr01-1014_31]|nr:MAG: hypothetical protein G01um101431_1117 [Parcubacteria group bacterium Gr01-1014_31]